MTAADQNVTRDLRGQEDDAEAGAPRWLVAIVVVLGVAFLAMLALIIVKLIAGDGPSSTTAQEPAPVAVATNAEMDTASAAVAMRDFNIQRPEGAALVRAELAGRELLLHFRGADGSDILIVLNRMTGQENRVVVAP